MKKLFQMTSSLVDINHKFVEHGHTDIEVDTRQQQLN